MKKDVLYPLRKLHGYIYEWNIKNRQHRELVNEHKKNPKTVFLLMTPAHCNIGDHAIAIAEKKLLKRIGIHIIEITGDKLNTMKVQKKLSVFNGMPILINGGGNLGTLWPEVENLQREIIVNNRRSRIIMLPNTIHYDSDISGQLELEKSIKIYNRHKHLYLYAREKTSYELMRKIYKNVKLVPDIVLSMEPYSNNSKRKGCLLCLRQDIEKTRTEDEDNQIYRQAEELFPNDVKYTDMIAKYNIMPAEREEAVKEKMNEFCTAELVITDRLHGMIFCAVTGTPCIVVNSKSPKVKGCYEWIKHLEYIKFADKTEMIPEVYKHLQKENCVYDNQNLNGFYKELGEDILRIFGY